MEHLQAFGTSIDEHAFVVFLAVKSLTLFEQDKCRATSKNRHQDYQPCKETGEAVSHDEAYNGTTDGSCRPVDVPALDSHEFKRPLQPLEHGIFQWPGVTVHSGHGLAADAEEQRECLCSGDQEDAGAHNHHDGLLENLLPNCKVLNINTPKKQKVPKETNWKQKFQKPQNENICLTYLNTEMNGNFHFLSFCAAFLKVQNQVL